jgi:hypothetical protein
MKTMVGCCAAEDEELLRCLAQDEPKKTIAASKQANGERRLGMR